MIKLPFVILSFFFWLYAPAACRGYYLAERLLLRVEVNDELLVDGLGDVGALGVVDELAAEGGTVPLEPGVVVGTRGEGVGDDFERLAAFADGDDIALAETVGGDVDDFAVDSDMTMGNQLTGLCAAAGDAEAVDDVVETGLDEFHEFLTGDATATGGFGVEFAELALEDAVGVFGFLLLLELDAVLGEFAAAAVLAVHAGGVGFLLVALVRAIDRLVELSCDFGLRTCVSCHLFFLLYVNRLIITRDDASEGGNHCGAAG